MSNAGLVLSACDSSTHIWSKVLSSYLPRKKQTILLCLSLLLDFSTSIVSTISWKPDRNPRTTLVSGSIDGSIVGFSAAIVASRILLTILNSSVDKPVLLSSLYQAHTTVSLLNRKQFTNNHQAKLTKLRVGCVSRSLIRPFRAKCL